MTWEELNKKHDYDHDGLIECMPCDVRIEISKMWAEERCIHTARQSAFLKG